MKMGMGSIKLHCFKGEVSLRKVIRAKLIQQHCLLVYRYEQVNRTPNEFGIWYLRSYKRKKVKYILEKETTFLTVRVSGYIT